MINSLKKSWLVLAISFVLIVGLGISASALDVYTVKAGDSLWRISNTNFLTVTQIKQYNNLTFDTIFINQRLKLISSVKYTVQKGDTLWLISVKYNTTITRIKLFNNMNSDMLNINQVIFIPAIAPQVVTPPVVNGPTPVLNWPSITYIVKAGDYLSVVSAKFGVPAADIVKYNYLRDGDWLNEGQKIAINGYAPRNYDILPGESTAPANRGRLVDWFLDGQFLIRRNDVFVITDVQTGLRFKVKMLGGINHSDVETLTASDTALMQRIFPQWNWSPRAVVIFHNGMNIAASISGMPHSFDSIADNNVTGHFDLYLKNSVSHSAEASSVYVLQHQACVLKAQ